MARPISTAVSISPLTDTEELDRQAFKQAFIEDYNITSNSDKLILDLASFEYVKSKRLQTQELTNGHIMGNIRFHPISELVRLLSLMDASRAAKLRGKQQGSSEERELREYFLSLSATSAKPRANGYKYNSLEKIPTNAIGKRREDM